VDNSVLKNEVLQYVDEIFGWMQSIRRDLHMYPELGMEEHRTSKMICKYLEELGIQYESGIANTGVVGLIKVENPASTIALRADMDALPITEQNNISYKSKNVGLMHACGHDAHVAIQLGTAKLLVKMKDKLKSNVKLIFQPAEESVGGALPMIKEGVLKNPDVDLIFGLHIDSGQKCGIISLKYGVSQASVDTFKITVHGKSAHGAHPASGVDAILIAGHVITAVQSVVSRCIGATESLVISIGKINGGSKENIVADKVVMEGTMRALNPEIRDIAVNKLKKIVNSISESFGGQGDIDVSHEYCSLKNNDFVLKYIERNAENFIGKENIIKYKTPSMGGEDYAFFLNKIPGAFFKIGTKNEEKGIVDIAHNCNFNIDEDAMKVGIVMQALNVLNADSILGELKN
jgi:amidohydrolase